MGTHLVIVESPTKARTIERFLGSDYVVKASMGHVRDLPSSTIAVDTEKGFAPTYEVPKEKQEVVKNLQKELKDADDLWIATDEDREGEAIGWHLTEVLKRKKGQDIKRIVFHEITESAIKEAIANPRALDEQLIEAQQARRILDRLVGYTLSPLLWKKVYRGLSAGRVQSVAVRIIVDREREIQAFNPEEYWSIEATLKTETGEVFTAELKTRDGEKFVPVNEQEATEVVQTAEGADFAVSKVEEKETKRNPPAPFTTSTLQQEAGRKLGFSVKQTMVIAQQLYEGIELGGGQGQTGLITYMRTDSVHLSQKALADAKAVIKSEYGEKYVLDKPRAYKTKSKGAQEAHEAIRPTEISRTPDSLKGVLDAKQLKLYTLIWNRTVSTQMPAAILKRVGVDIAADRYGFRATGQTILFDGYLRIYSEGQDEEGDPHRRDQAVDGEKLLPDLSEGQELQREAIEPEQHFTKPPPRYTEASLVKKMEEEGIGRPSTYAPTISTIQARGYIRRENKQLVPEDVAFVVTDLLKEHFPNIVDLNFTAGMEESLDNVAEGKTDWVTFLGEFYGPFRKLVAEKTENLSRGDVQKERVLGKDEESGFDIIVRSGRFGPYAQVGRAEDLPEDVKPKSVSLPKGKNTENVTLADVLPLLQFPKVIGQIDGEDVTVLLGRYGPYIKTGKQNASIPEGIDPATVTVEQAKEFITQAKEFKRKQAEPIKVLDKDPTSGEEIKVMSGRFGPYVSDGETNASLPKSVLPEEVDFQYAIQLLDRKRNAPKRRGGRKKRG